MLKKDQSYLIPSEFYHFWVIKRNEVFIEFLINLNFFHAGNTFILAGRLGGKPKVLGLLFKFSQNLEKEFAKLSKTVLKTYKVFSILGSQSSGKSSLLNRLFKTNFEVLNARQRRSQTTKGIWVSNTP